jgi:hypothetical protein
MGSRRFALHPRVYGVRGGARSRPPPRGNHRGLRHIRRCRNDSRPIAARTWCARSGIAPPDSDSALIGMGAIPIHYGRGLAERLRPLSSNSKKATPTARSCSSPDDAGVTQLPHGRISARARRAAGSVRGHSRAADSRSAAADRLKDDRLKDSRLKDKGIGKKMLRSIVISSLARIRRPPPGTDPFFPRRGHEVSDDLGAHDGSTHFP